MKEKQRITIEMDKGLFRLFKSKCAIEEVSMTSVVIDAVKKYLEDDIKDPQGNAPRVFDVPSKTDIGDMTVTDSMNVNLNQKEEKSWIKRKLSL